MRKLVWLLLAVALSLGSTGCFLDDIRRDKPGISQLGGSSRAREIESGMSWSSL